MLPPIQAVAATSGVLCVSRPPTACTAVDAVVTVAGIVAGAVDAGTGAVFGAVDPVDVESVCVLV